MVKKDPNLILKKSEKWLHFPTSQMGRCLLYQELQIYGHNFVVMTTHLESTKECKFERQKQLSTCFNAILEQKSQNVILAGDLNIREAELKSIGGVPKDIFDAWQICGSLANTKFTWDLQLNDNLIFDFGKPRARYDRMFYRTSAEKLFKSTAFKLVGTEKIEACQLFPSDHFGMLVSFAVS